MTMGTGSTSQAGPGGTSRLVAPLITGVDAPFPAPMPPSSRVRPLRLGEAVRRVGPQSETGDSQSSSSEFSPVGTDPAEILSAASAPVVEPMNEAIGTMATSVNADFASRLERIAETIRDGGPGAVLAATPEDPLAALVAGYLLGSARGNTG